MSAADAGGLPYRFGWVTAWMALAMAFDVRAASTYTQHLGVGGAVVGWGLHAWAVAHGVSAALARPWGWYVLIAWPLVTLVASAIFAARIALTPRDAVIGVTGAMAWSLVCFTYFYRRRAHFGAAWRWRAAERWWPWLAGPETTPGPRGLASLPPGARRLFIASLLIWILLESAVR